MIDTLLVIIMSTTALWVVCQLLFPDESITVLIITWWLMRNGGVETHGSLRINRVHRKADMIVKQLDAQLRRGDINLADYTLNRYAVERLRSPKILDDVNRSYQVYVDVMRRLYQLSQNKLNT